MTPRSPRSWSIVNERAFLLPLTHFSVVSSLDIHVNLPKLHPKYEDPTRHFLSPYKVTAYGLDNYLQERLQSIKITNSLVGPAFRFGSEFCPDIAQPPFKITRRVRQGYWPVRKTGGAVKVKEIFSNFVGK